MNDALTELVGTLILSMVNLGKKLMAKGQVASANTSQLH